MNSYHHKTNVRCLRFFPPSSFGAQINAFTWKDVVRHNVAMLRNMVERYAKSSEK